MTEGENHTLSKLTIIIPTYNRQQILERQSKYWANSGVKLVILDGSNKAINQKIYSNLKINKDLTYIHSNSSINSRMNFAKKIIKTPYVITLNDDDFLIISSVKKAINMLEQNPEIVACRGQLLYGRLSANKSSVKFSDVYNQFSEFVVDQSTAIDRLKYAFSLYNSATSFSILRAEAWKASWGALDYQYSTTNVNEIFQNIMTYAFGKLYCMNSPYIVITNENQEINTMEDNRALLIENWWTEPKYYFEKEIFLKDVQFKVNQIQKILNTNETIAQDTIKEILNKWANSRADPSFTRKMLLPSIINKKAIFYFIKFGFYFFGENFYLKLRKMYIDYKLNRRFFELDERIKHKLKIPITEENFSELKIIQNYILNIK